jgi:hypothetical protein
MQDNGKTVHMRIVNTFTTPDTLDFKQEYSEDGQKWVTMATASSTGFAEGEVTLRQLLPR